MSRHLNPDQPSRIVLGMGSVDRSTNAITANTMSEYVLDAETEPVQAVVFGSVGDRDGANELEYFFETTSLASERSKELVGLGRHAMHYARFVDLNDSIINLIDKTEAPGLTVISPRMIGVEIMSLLQYSAKSGVDLSGITPSGISFYENNVRGCKSMEGLTVPMIATFRNIPANLGAATSNRLRQL